MKILLKIFMMMIVLLSGLFTHMFILAKRRNVIHHSFTLKKSQKLGKVLSIYFISDIHRRTIDDELVEKVQSSGQIDIVIIGGDLAESGVSPSRIEHNVKSLSRLGQLFFIWGNNDREVGEKSIRDIISRNGGVILDNENSRIDGHPEWGICGTDDPSSGNVDVERTLKNSDQFQHLIVATHTPSLFKKVEKQLTPDLMLAGHMHGGQIRCGKYGVQPLGQFTEKDGKAKLISNGYGTSLVPLRLGAVPESHVIKITY